MPFILRGVSVLGVDSVNVPMPWFAEKSGSGWRAIETAPFAVDGNERGAGRHGAGVHQILKASSAGVPWSKWVAEQRTKAP